MLSFRISDGNNSVHLDNRIGRLLRLPISSSSAAFVPTEQNYKKAQDEKRYGLGFCQTGDREGTNGKTRHFQRKENDFTSESLRRVWKGEYKAFFEVLRGFCKEEREL
ncbi:hypothetical protein SLA2020_515250 [Shorea laevis]